jgi:hypothetical protein
MMKDRDRRFRRNSFDVAVDVFVEYDVAKNEDSRPAPLSNPRRIDSTISKEQSLLASRRNADKITTSSALKQGGLRERARPFQIQWRHAFKRCRTSSGESERRSHKGPSIPGISVMTRAAPQIASRRVKMPAAFQSGN